MNSLAKTSNRGGWLQPWFRDFFDTESFFDGGKWLQPNLPAVNVSENEKSFMVDVIAPGFKKEDFKVSADDEVLTISAESESETKDDQKNYNRREYSYSSFTRSFHFPQNAKPDNIEATYADGVLKLTIPKDSKQAKPSTTIPIQ